MKKKLYGILVILCFQTLITSAQSFKILEDGFKFKEFPKVEFKFWTRSFKDIDTSKLIIKENDVTISGIALQPISENAERKVAVNKILLILIENHYLPKGIGERFFFKNILSKGLSGRIKPGDKIYVGTFDWYRDNKYMFLQSNNAADDETTVLNMINSIQAPAPLKNTQQGADINHALNQAIEFLAKIKDTLPKNILLLSDDFRNIVNSKTPEDVRNESVKYDIPIYAIGFNMNAERDVKISKDDICIPTNGAYFNNMNNDVNACSEKLGEFIDGMNVNSTGKVYSASFISTQKKVGQKVNISMGADEKNLVSTTIGYPFNFFAWVKENIILSIGLFLLLVGLGVLVYFWLKKMKQKKILKIIEAQEEELQKRQTDSEIERLRLMQLEGDRKLKDQRNQFEDEAKLDKLKKLMKAKGVTPRVTYEYNGQRGQFFIDSPKYTIGREANSNSFYIAVPSISRNHAEIDFNENGQFTIKDLHSTNGVIVNGNKVDMALLKHADIITLGDVTFKFNL